LFDLLYVSEYFDNLSSQSAEFNKPTDIFRDAPQFTTQSEAAAFNDGVRFAIEKLGIEVVGAVEHKANQLLKRMGIGGANGHNDAELERPTGI